MEEILDTDRSAIIKYKNTDNDADVEDSDWEVDFENSDWDKIEDLAIKCLNLSQFLQGSTDLRLQEKFVAS